MGFRSYFNGRNALNVYIDQVKEKLLSLSEVKGVHDLHMWSITSDFPALSCRQDGDRQDVLFKAKKLLHDEFELHHVTIQIDKEGIMNCSADGHRN